MGSLFWIIVAIPTVMFTVIIVGFIVATVWDISIARRNRSDIMFQLSRDYSAVRRRARK